MKAVNVALIEPVGSHGGMDYYDSGLCGGLASNGVPVTWYTCDVSEPCGSIAFEVKRPFERIWGKEPAWKRGLRYVRGLFSTMHDARARKASIAHFHFFHVGPLEALGVMLARLYGLKAVATIHDVEAFKPGLTSTSLRDLTYRLCARLIVHNRVSRDELISRCQVSAAKIRVIPHGSYLGLIAPAMDRNLARDTLGLPQDEKVVLFFGQIKEVKGLDLLIEAFGKHREAMAPVHLVIAGKVWKDDFARYQALIDQYGLGDFCHLHIRYIPDDELSTFYSAADLIALPYRRIYQSGVLLMAMSFGVPVLASDLPGMKEIITDGENGFLFGAGDADLLGKQLVQVLSATPDVGKVVAQASADMQSKFSWKTIAAQTLFAYKELLMVEKV
ncbi:glycosyltransferase family 4 protein [Chitinimonas arctica]|uniref:glycosyltransferase family 4 protein n=1 Tax=Chitinimonas arctica TaxID=2594795 RepID=UPI0015D11F9B|nr:glycosyltransferase family 4 protein [Chitinimonas arctica]